MASKRYNLIGKIIKLNASHGKNNQFWARFSLDRAERRAVRVVAFGKKAADLYANFREGDKVKLFGYFAPETRLEDGKTVRTNRFNVLWSGKPVPKAVVTA